ncbi:hypothetical protein [Deinococcus sp.]|uniref:hypothetical protein n=1 Tax=Deinococcus sp. TaxID=47478 RepID=UPI0025B7CA51|nr:hypothetical protein [Deinococcus sp.]
MYISDEDAFGYWVFQNPDVVKDFKDSLPSGISEQLDYSVNSLDVLETWLTENFNTVDEITSFVNVSVLDGSARYVGRVFLANLGGKWGIDIHNKDNMYHSLPVIESKVGVTCPLSVVSTSIDRRTGHFISDVLRAKMKRLPADLTA